MNGAGVHTPDVQGKGIVVIALNITGSTRNFRVVCSLQMLREHMTGL